MLGERAGLVDIHWVKIRAPAKALHVLSISLLMVSECEAKSTRFTN